uniref:Uncharacterized protein n=1 Tax=Arundo donax TaxID=35708 RepID=A0A0A9F7B7_ARUDO
MPYMTHHQTGFYVVHATHIAYNNLQKVDFSEFVSIMCLSLSYTSLPSKGEEPA